MLLVAPPSTYFVAKLTHLLPRPSSSPPPLFPKVPRPKYLEIARLVAMGNVCPLQKERRKTERMRKECNLAPRYPGSYNHPHRTDREQFHDLHGPFVFPSQTTVEVWKLLSFLSQTCTIIAEQTGKKRPCVLETPGSGCGGTGWQLFVPVKDVS